MFTRKSQVMWVSSVSRKFKKEKNCPIGWKRAVAVCVTLIINAFPTEDMCSPALVATGQILKVSRACKEWLSIAQFVLCTVFSRMTREKTSFFTIAWKRTFSLCNIHLRCVNNPVLALTALQYHWEPCASVDRKWDLHKSQTLNLWFSLKYSPLVGAGD